MIVTKIEKQKKDSSRYSVFIDDNFAFGLIMQDILYFKLEEGKEISEEKYNFILDSVVYIKAQAAAMTYLGFKARTEKEVRNKLSEKQFNLDITDRVIDFLKKYNYVNDRKYCDSYIKDSIRLKPKGRILLKYELSQRGVKDSIIEEAIFESELNEFEGAKTLLEKKLSKVYEITPKEKKKAFDYLLRKGYSSDIIKEAFDCTNEEL